MSYSLDPAQAGYSIGPDLCPNCLKRLSELGIQIQGLRSIQMLVQKIWMLEPRHKISKNGMCDQQRLRLACAYAQSDQNLCLSLEYSMTVKLLTEQHLEFLSLKGGCTGSYDPTLVKMPHCWKPHVVAHYIIFAMQGKHLF